MTKFLNLKIAITDEVHFKAVCEVLESMGFSMSNHSMGPYPFDGDNSVVTYSDKTYMEYCHRCAGDDCELVTLNDLLIMRDKQFMENIHA